MIDFKPAQLSDKPWVDELLSYHNYRGSEYCFGTYYIWKQAFRLKIARVGDCFTAISEGNPTMYLFPCGTGDIVPVLDALRADAAERGLPFILYGITDETKALLETVSPGAYTYQPNRDAFDYIYNTSDLISLSGKKYHGKRNHIARFKGNNDYVYEPITPQNIPDCIKMNEEWCHRNGCSESESLQEEGCAVRQALLNFDALGFVGGLLRVDGRVVAYTVGERLTNDTICVHFEKAFSEIQGAYPTINQEFASHAMQEYLYANREEDMGLEGLRRAKESYHPAILLTKYRAVLVETQ